MTEEWVEYIKKFDSLIQEALRTCAKNTLQKLYKSLHGDGSIGPTSILEIEINLINNKIEFTPSIKECNDFLGNLYTILINSVKLIPKLCDKFQLPKSSIKSIEYYEIIENDDECQQLRKQIIDEIEYNQLQINDYLNIWSPFKTIWELDKNIFMEKMNETLNNAVGFNINIGRYKDIINQISMQEIFTNIHFVMIKSNNLKMSLYVNIEDWQMRFMELLKEKSINKITELYTYVDKNVEQILQIPKSIEEMQIALKLFEHITDEIPEQETIMPLINEYFQTMGLFVML